MKETLIEWLNSLYVPIGKEDEFAEVLNAAEKGMIRDFKSTDEGIGIPIAVIMIAGHEPRAAFKGVKKLVADTGMMGKEWGLLAVYKPDVGIGFGVTPIRFKYEAHRVLVRMASK